MFTLNLFRNDDVTWPVQLLDSTGAPINITGYTVRFTVRKNNAADLTNISTDTTAVIAKVITSFTDPTNGKFVLVLSHTDTNIEPGTYQCDFQFTSGSGAISTPDTGEFVVAPDVTRHI